VAGGVERLVFDAAAVLGEHVPEQLDRDVAARERMRAAFGVIA
jgi:hypothetical protein